MYYTDFYPSGQRIRALARNMSVSFGQHFVDFTDAQVDTGRYGSASDVVRAGLRLLEEHEANVKALQDARVAGENSGSPVPFEESAFAKRLRSDTSHREAP